ncbi:MAG: DUF4275 family protein [Chitinophagales bacterium]
MENIISRLNSQNIDYVELPETDFEKIRNLWIEKFTKGYKAPHIDRYLWHIFSYNYGLAIEGEIAEIKYKKQYPCDLLIFNERFNFCLKIEKSAIPDIQIDDFMDDIYIVHANYRWTYVIPHEIDSMGPYFKKIID